MRSGGSVTEEKRQTVALAERSYDIVVGSGLIARAADYIAPLLTSKRSIILTDETVAVHYAQPLLASLAGAGIRSDVITVKPGEGSKSFATFEQVMEQLLAMKPDRKTMLIALGGGVIGDLTGFAASVLLRGVPFIQIPTTLLAQVDSSVGGKTAINSSNGKNLIGTFYQPRMVLADTDTLKTLSQRELRAGYAEIIKYGLIMDQEFYRWCLENGSKLLAGDAAAIQHAVVSSCAFKAAVVKADEREANDMRALLNFGHTFGHALEAETGFGEILLHGEAVAIGMVMACRLSQRLGLIDVGVEQELAAHFKALNMKSHPQDVAGKTWDVGRIVAHFAEDKKAEDGKLTFIALEGTGAAKVVKSVEAALARDVVASFLQ